MDKEQLGPRSVSYDPSRRQKLLSLRHNQRSIIDFSRTFSKKADFLENVSKSKTITETDRIEDPSADYHLWWNLPPEKVLLVKKIGDPNVSAKFREIARWMIKEKDLMLIVEPKVYNAEENKELLQELKDGFITWNDGCDQQKVLKEVDFAISLGGDGTLLYTASLFEGTVPPVVSLAMGSLGFLTPFDVQNYQDAVDRVLNKYVSITQRLRLECKFLTEQQMKIKMEEDICALSPPIMEGEPKLTFTPKKQQVVGLEAAKKKEFTSLENKTVQKRSLVMNEIVVDRGPSPYLTNIEIYCNGRLMTTVQGDGVIVSTPTGSTAYALAAGASMVHPSVASIVICPICPHSLSFRPVVIPAGVEIMICVSQNARNSAWVGFDGRDRQELKQGDSVVITASDHPVPCINNTGHVTDWFDSLSRCLHWNVREVQKPMS